MSTHLASYSYSIAEPAAAQADLLSLLCLQTSQNLLGRRSFQQCFPMHWCLQKCKQIGSCSSNECQLASCCQLVWAVAGCSQGVPCTALPGLLLSEPRQEKQPPGPPLCTTAATEEAFCSSDTALSKAIKASSEHRNPTKKREGKTSPFCLPSDAKVLQGAGLNSVWSYSICAICGGLLSELQPRFQLQC